MNQTEKQIPIRMSGWVTTIAGWFIVIFIAYTKWHYMAECWSAPEGQGFIPGVTYAGWLVGSLVFLWIITAGNTVLLKNKAVVYTFMGNYVGTLRGPGYFFTPFWWGSFNKTNLAIETISVPAITVSDKDGNPIIIGCNIFAYVKDTYAWAFAISGKDETYLTQKGEVALRTIAKKYPLTAKEETTHSLSNSQEEVMKALVKELEISFAVAGYGLQEENPVGITTLTYAPEIAGAMLQRQQAKATLEAREVIVEGAVGIVETAIERMEKDGKVTFTPENKQKLITGMLMVLSSSHAPTVTVPATAE